MRVDLTCTQPRRSLVTALRVLREVLTQGGHRVVCHWPVAAETTTDEDARQTMPKTLATSALEDMRGLEWCSSCCQVITRCVCDHAACKPLFGLAFTLRQTSLIPRNVLSP